MEGEDHLAFERNKAEFDVNEMKIVWAGSRQEFELSDRISRLVASDPVNEFPLSFFFNLLLHYAIIIAYTYLCFDFFCFFFLL